MNDDESSTGCRIVISGAPGCGKTTLSRQLCRDHSLKQPNNYRMVALVDLRKLSLILVGEVEQLRVDCVQECVSTCTYLT